MDDLRHSLRAGLSCSADNDVMDEHRSAAGQAPRSILILSDIRFFREGLAEILKHNGVFGLVSLSADLDEAIFVATDTKPEIILVDASLPDGLRAVARLDDLVPLSKVVALALAETEIAVIAWAKAGVSGYVPRSTSLAELVSLLEGIARGEQACSKKIAASLLHWVNRSARPVDIHPFATASLTVREQQIIQAISNGLSNKEIARQLNIGVGTTKSHVHNVLGKLKLSRRSEIVLLMNVSPFSFGAHWNVEPQLQEHPFNDRYTSSNSSLSPLNHRDRLALRERTDLLRQNSSQLLNR
jgi:DNA-binding NarL/FixJ family response regulator